MRSAASRRNDRPPIPVPGAADRSPISRPTVQRRALVRPRLWPAAGGYPADHPYVRRYWTAAIGPGAVSDLLRLIRAAEKSLSISRPTYTPALARCGLVMGDGRGLWVRATVPELPPFLLRRLPAYLREEARLVGGGGETASDRR